MREKKVMKDKVAKVPKGDDGIAKTRNNVPMPHMFKFNNGGDVTPYIETPSSIGVCFKLIK